jgi:hypothetical protein
MGNFMKTLGVLVETGRIAGAQLRVSYNYHAVFWHPFKFAAKII